jgi:hypothetical protein
VLYLAKTTPGNPAHLRSKRAFIRSFVRCGCTESQWVLGQRTDRSDVRIWNKFGATVESLLAPLRCRTQRHTHAALCHAHRGRDDEWEWKGKQAARPSDLSRTPREVPAFLLRALQESRWKCWDGTTGIQDDYTTMLIRGVWPRSIATRRPSFPPPPIPVSSQCERTRVKLLLPPNRDSAQDWKRGRRVKKKKKRACSELAGTRWICRARENSKILLLCASSD